VYARRQYRECLNTKSSLKHYYHAQAHLQLGQAMITHKRGSRTIKVIAGVNKRIPIKLWQIKVTKDTNTTTAIS